MSFQQMTGWTLSYQPTEVTPSIFHEVAQNQQVITLPPFSARHDLPARLSPREVQELSETEECWLPVCVMSDYLRAILTERQNYNRQLLTAPIGLLHLSQTEIQKKNVSRSFSFVEARRAASTLADFLSEVQTLRVHLWLQENETMSRLPIFNRRTPQNPECYAVSFRKLLDHGLHVTGMDAVGIYVMESDEYLKLRSSSNLDFMQLSNSARKISACPYDMHAMNGECMIYDVANQLEGALPPENCVSAICLPLCTGRSLFGTIWLYSNQVERISEQTLFWAELFADHVSLEMEQTALVRRFQHSFEYSSTLKQAAALQAARTPIPAHFLKKIGLYGWKNEARRISTPEQRMPKEETENYDEAAASGCFYDWCPLPNSNKILVSICDVGMDGLAGAILAVSVKSAMRAHAEYETTAADILMKTHQTICSQSFGNQKISLFCGVLDLDTLNNGTKKDRALQMNFAHMGSFRGIRFLPHGYNEPILLDPATPDQYLGSKQDISCSQGVISLPEGATFLIMNDGLKNTHGNEESRANLWRSLETFHFAQPKAFAYDIGVRTRDLLATMPISFGVDQELLVVQCLASSNNER